jgi:cytoplasmic iron level regulating protein YaaA (DUF328/UPF0246 family)
VITVLSPAKTLDFESPVHTERATTPQLLDHAAQLMTILSGHDASDLGRLMKLSSSLSELNAERNARWQRDAHMAGASGTGDDHGDARQAILAFTGDVYKGMAPPELSEDALGFAQEHVRILSGLYGVLRPLDLMMPYRLEMGTRFSTSRGKNLYEFWSDRIAGALSHELAGHTNPVVLNLASQEYFKAVDGMLPVTRIVTPVFKEQRAGGPKVIGIHAKRQRGRMTRYIIDNRIDTPEALKGYTLDDYYYADRLSSETEWVFLR